MHTQFRQAALYINRALENLKLSKFLEALSCFVAAYTRDQQLPDQLRLTPLYYRFFVLAVYVRKSTNTHTQTQTHTAHYAQRIAPFGGGSYANTDGTDTEERAAAVYGPLLQRLREAKAIADPLGLLYSPYALPQKVVELQMNAKTDGDVDPAALRLYLVPKPQPSASPP